MPGLARAHTPPLLPVPSNPTTTTTTHSHTPTPPRAEFSTHSVTGPIVGPDGEIKVAWGDGAAFTTVDSGQLGANPCNDTAPYTGAFRSQDPTRLNGKLISVNPDTLAWRIISSGHRNPFRLGTYKNKLFATETGA